MKLGFVLRSLSVLGPGKKPAQVTFTRGLNVIAGPSDTGKSFIVQCIDYALGSGDLPKKIPEAEGYSSVVLEIEANSDKRVYTFERSLRGGDVLCKSDGQRDRVLGAKHQGGKADTVSQFLLDLSGLGSKKVRTNENGKTRPLSFRDIARLVIIDEETIITETSPVLSGQHTSKTSECGVFRILLTGTDDSSIIAKEDSKIAKGRQAGRVELLEGLLKNAQERVAEFGEVGTLHEEYDRLSRLDASIQAAVADRDAAQASAAPLEAKRRAAWVEVRTVDSKLVVMAGLQERFDLLQQQYSSDLRRLDTIAEAGFRLTQLKEERCPMCGALSEHHEHMHSQITLAPEDVSHACKAEAAKTARLLQDLQTTRAATATEVSQLREALDKRQLEFISISTELKTLMERHVDVLAKKVDELRERAEACRRGIELLERIQELQGLLQDANKPKKKQKTDVADAAVSTAQADSFSKEVESLLTAWHFPGLDRVSFSENDQDVVISGRARKSHGKGVRAITRAAFNLGLLQFCTSDEQPFPNLVLLDSPLLVYEEPDESESSFPQHIKQHFWESVKTSFTAAQVIIIENSKQLPSDGTMADVSLVLFTGNEQGRRGFIPGPN